jgi:hypothetical protein
VPPTGCPRAALPARVVGPTSNHVWCLAHGFGSPGQDDLRFAQHDLLCRLNDRLEAGPAKPVDRECRGFNRQAGTKPDVTREVRSVGRGLKHVAEDHMIHGVGRYVGAGDGALGGKGSQVCGGVILKCTTEGAEAGAGTREKDDVRLPGRGHLSGISPRGWGPFKQKLLLIPPDG